MLTIFGPAIPLLPTSVASCTLSMNKLNSPESLAGTSIFVTLSVGSFVLVMVHSAICPATSVMLPLASQSPPMMVV